MKHPSTLWLAAALAAGCGADAPRSAETPAAERPASVGAEQTTTDRTAMAPPPDAPEPAAEPAAAHLRDVNVYLSAPSPVGIVPSEHAEAFPIHVHVENQGDTPLRVDDLLARVVVTQPGETGREVVCEDPEFGSIRLVEDQDPVIEPGSAVRFTASLPCGLEDTGDYDVVAELLFAGASEAVGVPAPTDPHRAASFPLEVSDLEPPFARERPTVAEVPPIDPARLDAMPTRLED